MPTAAPGTRVPVGAVSRFRSAARRTCRASLGIVILASAVASVPAGAADASGAVARAVVAGLASDRTWTRLVHASPRVFGKGFEPAIVSADFYLADTGSFSPEAELDATLAAFADAADSPPPDPDTDPRCRYRARWLWLSEVLPDTVGAAAPPSCPAFDAWARLDEVRSLSLMHVSGHFGNPASAFGHLLLRADTDTSGGVRGLRDPGVNFGARVPAGDNSLVYVLKGLFGGYDAGFLEQPFHQHDAVYSATEQRDMWAYRLDLDAARREFLFAHLWELRTARFDYYFLKYNCARYLSLLLELVVDAPLLPGVQPWHLPQSVFERLETLATPDGRPLIRDVRFVPSLERESVARFTALARDDARAANDVITAFEVDAEDGGKTRSDSDVQVERQVERLDEALAGTREPALDFLLAWTDYREARAGTAARDAWGARKRRLLAERLRRPIGAGRFVVPALAPPARGPSARTLRLGVERTGGGAGRTVLGIAPYAYDVLNDNRGGLIDSGFRLLDTSLAFDHDTGSVALRRVDLLAVEKLSPPAAAIVGESRLLWRGNLSVVDEDPSCLNCSGLVLTGGIGRGVRVGTTRAAGGAGGAGRAGESGEAGGGIRGRGVAYAFLDASVGTERSLIGPAIGVLYRPRAMLAVRAELGHARASDGRGITSVRAEAFVRVGRQGSVALSATRIDALESLSVGASLRW